VADLKHSVRPVQGLGASRILWMERNYKEPTAKGANGSEIFLFDSLGSFQDLDTYEIPESENRFCNNNDPRHEPSDWPEQCDQRDWYSGEDDWQQTVEHWRDGFMADEIDKLSAEISAKAEGMVVNRKRRRRFNGVAGDLDGDRWVNGMFDSAFVDRPRSGGRQSPIVNLVFDWGGNAFLKPEELQWSGVAGVALAKALEAKGWSVGLYASVILKSTTHSKWTFNLTVPVKRPEEPVRIGQMGAQFCHPASFRCRAFRVMESLSYMRMGDGLGRCVRWAEMPKRITDYYTTTLGGNTMLLDGARDSSQAASVVKQVLDGIRTPLHVEG
jgi:hypothetical protein